MQNLNTNIHIQIPCQLAYAQIANFRLWLAFLIRSDYSFPESAKYVVRFLRNKFYSQWSNDWPNWSSNWLNCIGDLICMYRTILYPWSPFPTLMTDLGTHSVSVASATEFRIQLGTVVIGPAQCFNAGRPPAKGPQWLEWVQRRASFNLLGPYPLPCGRELTLLIWWCSSSQLGVAGGKKSGISQVQSNNIRRP